MERASKIFAYIAVGFAFVYAVLFFLLAVMGFVGMFQYYPPFVKPELRIVFDIFLLVYGFFEIGVGILAIYHYILVDRGQFDKIVLIFMIVMATLTFNIPLILSASFVLPETRRY